MNKDLEMILNKIESIGGKEVELEIEGLGGSETISIYIFLREEFEEGQLGYRSDGEGISFIGDNEGDWKESWHVIGYETLMGDPILVDISEKEYPVMTAMHGEEDWEPQELFPSLDKFLNKL